MPQRKRIVILGGGFGGAYAAQAMQRTLRGLNAEIVLINRDNYFIFYPFLVEAGTGSLEPRHAVVPLRAFVPRATLLMAEVRSIDRQRQTVRYRLIDDDREDEIGYDQLVIALGSLTKTPPVEGLREYGFGMKKLRDAVGLRDRAIRLLELANAEDDPAERKRLLHFVVVGGNYTGVEVAGEFDMFLRRATRMYPNLSPDDCRITLVEMVDRILSTLGEELSDFAVDRMRRRGIDVRLNTTVESIAEDHVVLSSGDTLATRTVIWCAGIQPNPLIRTLDVPVDDKGYILCERDLRVRGCEDLWAIGDCAVNIDAEGNPYPATAQHATRQAKVLAKNIANVLRNKPAEPCDITSQGMIAPLGCRTGVAKVMGIKLSGFPAWFLWRTVYLFKIPGLARKVRVALDWTIDLFFRRDIVQLGLHLPRADRMPTAEHHRRSA